MSIWLSKARNRLLPLRGLRTLREVPLFVRVFLLAASVPLLLRLDLKTLQVLLEPRFTPPPQTPAEIRQLTARIENVLKFGKPLVRPGCLTRGVTHYYFLRRSGVDVSLCFGVGKVGDEIVGHCWLSRHGEPFLESADPRKLFAPLYTIPQNNVTASLPHNDRH